MSDSQHKPKFGMSPYAVSQEPPGYKVDAVSERGWTIAYLGWLRRRGFHDEANRIEIKSNKQKAKYAKNKTSEC